MSIRYTKIKKKPTTFTRLFGVSVSQFEEILANVDPDWNSRILGQYKRPGRHYALDLEDMVLMLLLYKNTQLNPCI
jgi:hypothetical protein